MIASLSGKWRRLGEIGGHTSRYYLFWISFVLILTASARTGQLSFTSLVILLCFVAVMKVALKPLSHEFMARFHFYVKSMSWLLGLMATGAMLSWIMGPYALGPYTQVFYQGLSTLITMGWTVFVMAFLFSAIRVERNTLFAGLAVYFLLAASWAELFELIQLLEPDSFVPPLTTRGTNSSLFDLDSIYLSLSSITTLGGGASQPISPAARFTVTLEAAAGNIYLAVMIARLVALHKSPAPDGPATLPPGPRKVRSSLYKRAMRLRRRR